MFITYLADSMVLNLNAEHSFLIGSCCIFVFCLLNHFCWHDDVKFVDVCVFELGFLLVFVDWCSVSMLV